MKHLLILTAMLYLGACKNAPSEQSDRKDGFTPILKTKEDSLYHAVMQGHDLGMAKMGKLRKHLKQVQHELDSMHNLSPKKIDRVYQQALLDLEQQLNEADHSMFTWMEEFKVDSAVADKDKRIIYLESEKMKVKKVSDKILTSLQSADSLFKKNDR